MNNNNEVDDFFGDEDTSTSHEILLEQRATERLKTEMKSSGYRDGIQKQMENEPHLQLGFDLAYRNFARIGFRLGQLRSLGAYLDGCKSDSTFLSQLYDRLDKIENDKSYESLLVWYGERNLSADKLCAYLNSLEQKLVKLNDYFLNSSSQNEFKSNVLWALNDLQIKKTTDRCIDDDDDDDNISLDQLNVEQKLNI